jgi:hypothetical protein
VPLTNAGRDIMANAIVGAAYTAFNNANAYLGVGTDGQTFSVNDTDLNPSGSGSKYRQGMEAGYPQQAANVLTYRALIPTGSGNFAWAEWGLFNAAVGGTMLNRKTEALGTKTSAQAWQLTATITVQAS